MEFVLCTFADHNRSSLIQLQLNKWQQKVFLYIIIQFTKPIFVFQTEFRQSEAVKHKCLLHYWSPPPHRQVWLVRTTSQMRPWEVAVSRRPSTAPLNQRRVVGEPCITPLHLRRRWVSRHHIEFDEVTIPVVNFNNKKKTSAEWLLTLCVCSYPVLQYDVSGGSEIDLLCTLPYIRMRTSTTLSSPSISRFL